MFAAAQTNSEETAVITAFELVVDELGNVAVEKQVKPVYSPDRDANLISTVAEWEQLEREGK